MCACVCVCARTRARVCVYGGGDEGLCMRVGMLVSEMSYVIYHSFVSVLI